MKQRDVVMLDSNEKVNNLFGIDMDGPLPNQTAMQKRAPKNIGNDDTGGHRGIIGVDQT
jgi:hypothetical protein